MYRVLFVCLGNICRSPLAEAIFRHYILYNEPFIVDSCGTAPYHIGKKPDYRTIENARLNGIKINHIGRQFNSKDFKTFDLILVMDRKNLKDLLSYREGQENKDKIKLIRTFGHNNEYDVPDPYYGNKENFQEVFDILTDSVLGLLTKLRLNDESHY